MEPIKIWHFGHGKEKYCLLKPLACMWIPVRKLQSMSMAHCDLSRFQSAAPVWQLYVTKNRLRRKIVLDKLQRVTSFCCAGMYGIDYRLACSVGVHI